MIKIQPGTIETFKSLNFRDKADYYKRLMDEMILENEPLFRAIYDNADLFVDSLGKYTEQELEPSLTNHIRINMISIALAVYHTIKAQTEADELERLYG